MHYVSGTTGTERFVTEAGGFKFLETDLSAASDIPAHTHENATIVVTLKGDYREWYRGTWTPHAPLTMIAKPAGERHANSIGPNSAQCLVLEFTEARARHFARAGLLWDGPVVQTCPDVAISALKIARELRHPDNASCMILEGAALDLVGQVSRARPPSYAHEPRWMKEVIELVHSEQSPLRLSQISLAIGVHPVHLARTFRRVHGCSLGTYVRRLQVRRAIRMLSETSASVSEVAAAAGFYDQSHMGRMIRRETGLTPAGLRSGK